MPIRMRRKARGMEKVENLYCTARAQHVMPPCMDHADESGGANRFKPSRPSGPASASGMSEVKPNRGARRLGAESTLAADEACAIPSAIRVVEKWDAGRPPAAAMQDWPSGPSAALDIRGPLPECQPCPPLVRYESIRRGTLRILRRYCSDRTEPAWHSPKFAPYPAKLLAMQRVAP